LRFTLCALRFALCALRFALCALRFARGTIKLFACRQGASHVRLITYETQRRRGAERQRGQEENKDNLCASVCICGSSHYPNLVMILNSSDYFYCLVR
jgi:hypothetical protein